MSDVDLMKQRREGHILLGHLGQGMLLWEEEDWQAKALTSHLALVLVLKQGEEPSCRCFLDYQYRSGRSDQCFSSNPTERP